MDAAATNSEVTAQISDFTLFGVHERAMWHAGHIGKTLHIGKKVSTARPIRISTSRDDELKLSFHTKVNFVYRSYRLVVGIDVNSSMCAIDPVSGTLPVMDTLNGLAVCVFSTLSPSLIEFIFAGTSRELSVRWRRRLKQMPQTRKGPCQLFSCQCFSQENPAMDHCLW